MFTWLLLRCCVLYFMYIDMVVGIILYCFFFSLSFERFFFCCCCFLFIHLLCVTIVAGINRDRKRENRMVDEAISREYWYQQQKLIYSWVHIFNYWCAQMSTERRSITILFMALIDEYISQMQSNTDSTLEPHYFRLSIKPNIVCEFIIRFAIFVFLVSFLPQFGSPKNVCYFLIFFFYFLIFLFLIFF